MISNEFAAKRLKPGMSVVMPDRRMGTVDSEPFWSDLLQEWRCHVWPTHPPGHEHTPTDEMKKRHGWSPDPFPKCCEWVSLKCEDAIPVTEAT